MANTKTMPFIWSWTFQALCFALIHGQSTFFGDTFICDDGVNEIQCDYDDNIICNTDSDCIIECNFGCKGVIINAKQAKSLLINNCYNCDDSVIYCPQNGPYGNDNNCNINIMRDAININIYAQESFYDFNLIQINKTVHLLSSYLHCGDLSVIEYKCNLNIHGTSCIDQTKICQNYRIPTPSPTQLPTIPTISPTLTPTVSFINNETSTESISSTLIPTIVYMNNNNNDESSDDQDTVDQTLYVLLIVGLSVIWSGFFCCFLILNHFHSKKERDLMKTVNIMSRPKSPSYHPSPKKCLEKDDTIVPIKELKAPKNYRETHTEVNELYKITSLSDALALTIKEKKEEERQKNAPIVVDVINVHIHSPTPSPLALHQKLFHFDSEEKQQEEHAKPTRGQEEEQRQIIQPEFDKEVSAESTAFTIHEKEEKEDEETNSVDSDDSGDDSGDSGEDTEEEDKTIEGESLHDNNQNSRYYMHLVPNNYHCQPPPNLLSPHRYQHGNFVFTDNPHQIHQNHLSPRMYQHADNGGNGHNYRYYHPSLMSLPTGYNGYNVYNAYFNQSGLNIPPPPLPRNIYPSVTPGPAPKAQFTFLQSIKSRPRNYSDPTFPRKHLT